MTCIPYIPEEQPKKLCPECGHPISEHDSRDNWCHHIVPNDPCECGCVGKSYPADLKPAEPKKFSEMSSCEYLGCKYASRDEKGKPYCKDTNEYKNAAGEPVCGLRDDALIMEEKHCTDPSEQVYCLHIIPSEEVCGDCPRWGQPTPTMPPIESGDTQKTIFTPDYHTGFKVGVMRQRDADMAWHNAELDRIAEGKNE
jgi:hypothetical protein